MARLLGTWPVGSPEWHAARRHGLGGSEVAAAMGLSPWESPFSLWHRKRGEIGDIEDTPSMEWGRRLEDVVVAKFVEMHPELVVARSGTWCHEDRPWQIATPDRLLYGAAAFLGRSTPVEVLEVKTAHDADGWGEDGTDEIPVYYRVQILWYLDTFDLPRAHVAVLIGGSDYREYVVDYDADEAKALRAAARLFLDSIAADDRPDIDAHGQTYQAIRELHPDIDETVDVELSDEHAERYVRARAALKAAEADEQEARSIVADVMGDARRATWCDHTIARRQAKAGGMPYVVASRKLPDPSTFTDFSDAQEAA